MKKLLLFFSLLILSFTSFSAGRYWVSNVPGVWDNPLNWASSSGGTGGSSVPGASDIAYFNDNGTGDCILSSNTSVFGYRQMNGYTGTVSLGIFSLTVGTQSFQMREGNFNGGSAPITIAGYFFVDGGNFTSTSNVLSVAGYFKYGVANYFHNNGTMRMTCTTNQVFIQTGLSPKFYNVELQMQNNITLTITSGDTLTVMNNLDCIDGRLNGTTALIYKDCQVNAGFDGGSAPLRFVGSGNGNFNINNGNWIGNDVFIEKDLTSIPVTINDIDGNGIFTIGSFSKELRITKGTVLIEDGVIADIDFTHLIIDPEGIFVSSNKEVLFSGNFFNDGGFFDANNSLFTFDGNSDRFFNCTNTNDNLFYNVKINKGDGNILNIQPGDTLKSSNKTHLVNGQLTTGITAIVDTCLVESTFDHGNSTIVFVDGGTSWFVFNNGTWPQSDVIIEKASTSDQVIVRDIDGNNAVTIGGSLTDLRVFTGTFSFQPNLLATLEFGLLLLQSNGVFVASDYETQHSGSYHNNNGSLVHNNGLFRFNATSDNFFTSTVIDPFYNLSIDQSHEVALTINGSTAMRCVNNLRLINGKCLFGNLQADGDVIVSPSYDRGSSKLIFGGSKAQTFDLTGAIDNYSGDIFFNKTTANSVTLLSPFLFTGSNRTIAFNKGYLHTSQTNLFTIDDDLSYIGGNDSSFVNGPMVKIGNDAFIFPVGKDSVYAIAGISAPANVSDQFRAEYFNYTAHPTYNLLIKQPILTQISDCEYWMIDRINGSSNVTVRLSWGTPRSCGVTDPSLLLVARWNGAMWVNHGNGGTTGNPTAGTLVTSGVVTAFSPFTLASSSGINPLPVELIEFQANKEDRKVKLNWKTASEINNDYFQVEKSTNGTDWSILAKVDGVGNSINVIEYEAIDENPALDFNYYRLKQVDFNGDFEYSEIRVVKMSEIARECLVYPNPTKGKIVIDLSKIASKVSAKITNLAGQTIGFDEFYDVSSFELNIDGESGSYFLEIIADDNERTIVQVVKN